MSGRYLLDTSVIIGLLADDVQIKDNLARADQVFVPSIAVGELYYGAFKSRHVAQNLAQIDELAAGDVVLGCGGSTAREYGEIKNRLRAKGRPIPENDIWIAAIGLEHDLVVATRDAHFEEVEGLKVSVW
jgi:tRNA(fMet)-specific endonuclease VapC